MKKSFMKFVSAGSLLLAMAGLGVTACTDYTEIVESEYGYLREDPSASDEDCKENCGSKEEGSGKSSSSTKGGTGSSGSTSAGSTSAGSASVEMEESKPTCENQAFTKNHALPLRRWGYFGYVIPLKITKSGVQELYLSLGSDVSGIQGPDEWDTYGVTLGQVDDTNNWKFGTEIFSKNTESAIPAFAVNASIRGVYTYGRYVKFEFETKGTWLEKNAGKTINVGVNFYAPGVVSDSSGMGVDYYSIPSSDTSGLYYAYEDMDCSAYTSRTLKNVRCAALGDYNKNLSYNIVTKDPVLISKGDTVVWSLYNTNGYTVDSTFFGNFEVEWAFDNGTIISANQGKTSVRYEKLGSTAGQATLHVYGLEVTYSCENYSLNRFQADASGPIEISTIGKTANCSCTADRASINLEEDVGATYTFGGCDFPTDIDSIQWGGATPVTSNTALLTMDKIGRASPSLTLFDSDGLKYSASCPTVVAHNSYDAEYLLVAGAGSSAAITLEEGGPYLVAYNCSDITSAYSININTKYGYTNVKITDEAGTKVYLDQEVSYYYRLDVQRVIGSCTAGTQNFILVSVDGGPVTMYLY